MIYRCVFKANENYKSLVGDVCTIFPDGVDNAPSDLAPYQRKIDEVFAEDDGSEMIIFNGPAWLIALVGYAWYSNETRKHHNVLIYNKDKDIYERLTLGAIDDY
jgi:hypothetical protein